MRSAFFSCAAALQPAELVSVTDVSVCLCGCVSSNFVLIGTPSFSLILTKLGTYYLGLCVNTQKKTAEQISKFYILKALAIFF